MKACKCGCGEVPKPGNKFVRFHHLNVLNTSENPPRKYTPRPDEVPSGICECGCGKPTKIWNSRTDIKARRFRGYPSTRISGHGNQSERVGTLHPNWSGGRRMTDGGYVKIYARNHPNADGRGYIFEHRLIMSEHLGRPLDTSEIVHHKNGIKDDNRLDNLELTTFSEHTRMHNLEEGRIPPSRLGVRKVHAS